MKNTKTKIISILLSRKTELSIQTLCIAIALIVLISSCSKKRYTPNESNLKSKYVKVQDVLAVVEVAIAKAMADLPHSTTGAAYTTPAGSDPFNLLYYLKSVEVELANSFTLKGGGEVSFLVVKGGASRSSEKSTSFSYSFEPKPKVEPNFSDDDKMLKAGKDLMEALKNVGTCLKDYDNKYYDLKEVTIEVQFEITNSAEAGVEFKIAAFGISPSAGLEWGHGNTITLNFDLSKSKP